MSIFRVFTLLFMMGSLLMLAPVRAAAPSPLSSSQLAPTEALPTKLSRVEKRAVRQAVKVQAREAAPQAEQGIIMQILLLLLAFVLPPLAVLFKVGLRGHFWLNILLTLLFWVPGVIHAILVITNLV